MSSDQQINTSRIPSAIMHPEHQEIEVGEQKDSNTILVIQGKIALEAIGENILVLIDKFRSGFECKDCNETGVIESCICETLGHPGLNRFGGVCKFCGGSPVSVKGKECPKCKGAGQTIIIPESTKSMPTSGKIVSVGPRVPLRANGKAQERVVGERIIFGVHTGYFVPFKGNVRLRMMRYSEPLCLVYSLDPDITMDDFMVHEEPINNRGEIGVS